MIDVGVRQQNGVELGGVERKRFVVQRLQGFWPLKQAAIDQNISRLGFQPHARAGHAPRCAMKAQLYAHWRPQSGLVRRAQPSANKRRPPLIPVNAGAYYRNKLNRPQAPKSYTQMGFQPSGCAFASYYAPTYRASPPLNRHTSGGGATNWGSARVSPAVCQLRKNHRDTRS